jgi:hypothetical protein
MKLPKRHIARHCQWVGHGINHHGPAVLDLVTGRACGHETDEPAPTCEQMAQILLVDGGVANAATVCPVCGIRAPKIVIDPSAC